jgi:uncharacterized protein HemX
MLLRIFLILAILAGLGAGGVAFYEFNTQIPALAKQRDQEKEDKNKEIAAHNTTKKKLKDTEGKLAQTQQELADTKSDLTKATARADAQEKRATDLQDKLTKTAADLQDAQNTVAAYKSSGLSPDEVVKLDKNFKDAQKEIAVINGEKAVLARTLATTQAKLDKYEGRNPDILLPADLKGSVVVVDPKWDFVVLNVGADKGVIQDGEMLISRDGKLVAKVVVTSVQKDRSIANIVPGWKLGDVIEGDVATPAHPKSS